MRSTPHSHHLIIVVASQPEPSAAPRDALVQRDTIPPMVATAAGVEFCWVWCRRRSDGRWWRASWWVEGEDTLHTTLGDDFLKHLGWRGTSLTSFLLPWRILSLSRHCSERRRWGKSGGWRVGGYWLGGWRRRQRIWRRSPMNPMGIVDG